VISSIKVNIIHCQGRRWKNWR